MLYANVVVEILYSGPAIIPTVDERRIINCVEKFHLLLLLWKGDRGRTRSRAILSSDIHKGTVFDPILGLGVNFGVKH